MTTVRHAPGAGVRKPPREETARGDTWVGRRSLWDLIAAHTGVDCQRRARTRLLSLKRLSNERRAAPNGANPRAICDGHRAAVCALPWPVESRRIKRAQLS
jgi:hypothetical protein